MQKKILLKNKCFVKKKNFYPKYFGSKKLVQKNLGPKNCGPINFL